MAADGLIAVKSRYSVSATIDRVSAAVTAKGMTVFGLVDHAAGAEKAGMQLRPTEVLLFGNPMGGTPLMQDQQTAGIDLPLKVLAWQDADGQVWLGYNDIEWIVKRHGLGAASAAATKAIADGLAAIVKEASGN